MNHVMIDLETLGTKADSVILSIGAVKFDLGSDKVDDAAFYASISIDSNLDVGRRIDESTLLWWLTQSSAAQRVFHESKCSLETALIELASWYGSDKNIVWSNGADFDIAMLSHAYSQFKMSTPWAFWNTRCVRTYRSLPRAASIPKPTQGVAHNALSDALNQARHVQAIQAAL
jgi:hypothetical protein